eukprot:CAMPEP_0201513444 /NCGR_PEP_ID=MMETSP0161_2-20130828/5491_1 /ASSEMBLY_ACC=CAM_ASM_000251 /TAXON_ID=180227 /ORGANISM="Neoparamoeba aestuarina, Strain SoJaBio B1-5/56/2" /LENGTH=227 /DNA_ID=CAMNT_0047909655 /DNA_START=215 /DNA_END=898 /DNA_ORIENTATION=+
MSWRCSGKTNAELIANLKNASIIKSPQVEEAMLRVDRKNYVRDLSDKEAYRDSPQPIGHSVTISAPHMHAMCLEYMVDYLQPGMSALDCGSGSGYLAACMKHMVGEEGKVVGIEYVKELVPWSIENCKKDGFEAEPPGLTLLGGDASNGYQGMKFNAIHVGAAAPKIPQPLVDALTSPGVMLLPLGTYYQNLVMVRKSKTGEITTKELCGVSYVPFHMEGTSAYEEL